uniref:Fibrillin-1 n=1 Tax=Magallana gigas TaxID=29159 RepID=A0A8W8N5D1_MAGGI
MMIAADSSKCPVVILTPGLIATHIGTSVTFRAVIESYFEEALESRWSSLNQSIDINHPKFLGSKNIPFPELVINNVTFEDDGIYEIQVRIEDGWCINIRNNVTLDTIGVLDLDDPCNSSKECDLLKNLVCSSSSQSCVCNSDSYHRSRTCYLRTRLRAILSSSKATTSNITVWWNHPNQDADLVQSYNVSLRASDSSYIFQTPVELQTNYTFESSFLPGFLYYFEITSVVFLSDSKETIFVKTDSFNLVVGVPKVTFTNSEFSVSLFSKLEIKATVHNISNIPLTTAIKWQKNDEDINITDSRYIGSTNDLVAPKLVIRKVEYNKDHGQYYRCVATNSEGSWVASARINVHESFEFLESCNRSEQCSPGKQLTCKQGRCLCEYSYYHFNSTCYYKYDLRGYFNVESDKCKATFRWRHRIVDIRLMTDYLIMIYSIRDNLWVLENTTSVGIVAEFTYKPLPPGKIDRKNSIFSPNQLMLRWERSGHNTFLNHYRVEIDGHQQQTFGSIPKIYWTKQLTPGARYNVTITAVSYGYLSSDFWYGIKESKPYVDWIETDTGEKDGYSYLSFGQRDKLLRGDDKTSEALKSPITIYAGDGLEEGFNFVRIGSNGVIGLGEEFNSISIHEIDGEKLKDRRIVCPFWSDLKDDIGYVYYQTYKRGVDAENDLFLGKASKIVSLQFADFPDFMATWLVKATWVNMTLLGAKTSKWLLITDGQNTFTVFNYIDVNLKSIGNKKITIGYQYKKTSMKNQYSNTKRAFKMSENPGNRALNFGDPHIVTLDGKNYTFNGYGEYTMLKISKASIQFDLQARTDLATRANGTNINATIFSAFVAQDQTGSKLQIEMSRDKTRLVNEDSLFYYKKGLSYQNYTHPEFQPIFLDEIDDNKLENAKTKCGSNSSQACIFDYLATGDIALAESSGIEEASAQSDKTIVENESPIITGNSSIKVEVNKTVYMQFNASDDSNKLPLYNLLKQPQNFTFNKTTGIAKWTPTSAAISELSINVIDDVGAESPSIDVTIALCQGCGSNGRCSYDNIIPSENDRFSLAVCECDIGYSDIDECFEKTSGCEQICNNTLGSFECLCFPGFSLNSTTATCSIDAEKCCDGVQISCEYTCDPIEKKCLCPIGFQLAEDGQGCLECEEPYFGEDCSQICTCGQGMDRCDPVTGCVCKLGWTGENCTVDINECENNQDICGKEKVCQNLEGSYICNCNEGFQKNGDSCEDIDECSDITLNTCADDTNCQNLYGNYTCNCKSGFQKYGSHCEDVDECEKGIADCQQICINTIDGFNCECEFGYELDDVDRKTCQKVLNICALFDALNCSYGCRFDDNNFNKGYCFCPSGFELDFDNSSCKDIDECKESSTCQHHCTNFQGSFGCACTTGYTLQNDGRSCKDIDECLQDSHCEHYCNNTEGSYVCDCRDGYNLVNFSKCEDIDECSTIDTGPGGCQNCTNTPGSFHCSCLKGYVLNNNTMSNCTKCQEGYYGENCQEQCSCGQGSERCDHITGCYCKPGWTGALCETDINEYIDECVRDSPCDHICNNTDGSYVCSCRDGYNLVNVSKCEDIDECKTINTGIDGCQTCTNTLGSFYCLCFAGYTLNSTTLINCHNIDECEEQTADCALNATCSDTDGGYTCTCKTGFEGNGKKCKVCPNFKYGVNCSNNCACVLNNTKLCGHVTGECECTVGWTGTNCSEDIDECKSWSISCNESIFQVCVNTEGSAHCECQYGGSDISNCVRNDEFKVKLEISFNFAYTRENILKNTDKWIVEIKSQLETFYRKGVQGFTRVKVLSLRFGSVIIDHEVYSSDTKETLKVDTANSMVKLLRQDEKIVFFNQSTEVKKITLFTGNISIGWTLFIIIGIAVPLSMATIVLVLVYVCRKGKSKQKNKRCL